MNSVANHLKERRPRNSADWEREENKIASSYEQYVYLGLLVRVYRVSVC